MEKILAFLSNHKLTNATPMVFVQRASMFLAKLTRVVILSLLFLFATTNPLPRPREPVHYYQAILALVAATIPDTSIQPNERYAMFDLSCCIHRHTPLDARSIPILHNLGLINHEGQPSKAIRENCNIAGLIE